MTVLISPYATASDLTADCRTPRARRRPARFSADAVGVETTLHQRFAKRRVNFVNAHREFFFVTPLEVKAALMELQGNVLQFVEAPEALEWHQSQSIMKGESLAAP